MPILTPTKRPRGLWRGRWFFVPLLVALASVLGFGANPAFALPPDPIEPHPIGDTPYTPPANGFEWSMPSRFGLDINSDMLIDYHWNAATATYDRAYVNPSHFTVEFDGCRTGQEEESGDSQNTYYYQVGAQKFRVAPAAYTALPAGTACRLYYAPGGKELLSIEPLTAPEV